MPVPQIASANTGEDGAIMVLSDSVDQPIRFRAIWVGTGGDISIVHASGNTVLYPNVPGGMFGMGGVRVNVTGTTASGLRAVY